MATTVTATTKAIADAIDNDAERFQSRRYAKQRAYMAACAETRGMSSEDRLCYLEKKGVKSQDTPEMHDISKLLAAATYRGYLLRQSGEEEAQKELERLVAEDAKLRERYGVLHRQHYGC